MRHVTRNLATGRTSLPRQWLVLGLVPLMFWLNTGVWAQGIEWTGYYESEFFPQDFNDTLGFQNINKLRLDISAEIAKNINFAGDIVYRLVYGKTQFNAFEFLPESIVDTYIATVQMPREQLEPQFDFAWQDEHQLDNAFVTFYGTHWQLRVGKQQIPWGTGYTWNPTDLFNDKNVLDPTYEKVGVNALKLEIPFAAEGMFTALFGAGDTWRTSTKAIKLKHHLLGFDLSANFAEAMQEEFDYLRFLPTSERRRLLGGDFSGSLLGIGVWAEAARNLMELSDDYTQALAGTDYTFENGLYLIGEYYRNGLGKSDAEDYDINDWMRLLSAEGENLGRDYVFFGDRYPLTELWNWSNYALLNLSDSSGVFYPWFDLSLSDETTLDLVGYLPWGGSDTEYGAFGAGGFARVRVYF